jgi:hypothetical protein
LVFRQVVCLLVPQTFIPNEEVQAFLFTVN